MGKIATDQVLFESDVSLMDDSLLFRLTNNALNFFINQ